MKNNKKIKKWWEKYLFAELFEGGKNFDGLLGGRRTRDFSKFLLCLYNFIQFISIWNLY